jgi:predicted dithiol-disulfide oxidoreductase (DUF899 family)
MMAENNKVLEQEIEAAENDIRGARARLTELRRRLPPEPVSDYVFLKQDGTTIKLSEMFGDKKDLILIHNMGKKCRYCTLWADGFTGFLNHLENRAAFVVTSPDRPDVQKEFASGRKWNFKMFSCGENEFAEDMGFRDNDGRYLPGVSTFRMTSDGGMQRIAKSQFGPGDDFCSIWHLFDLLPDGPAGWEPQFNYE